MVFLTSVLGLVLGALIGFLLSSKYGRALLDALGHWRVLIPHARTIVSMPVASQVQLLTVLPEIDWVALEPHLDVIMVHRVALMGALPKLR
jgi:hypothetical protein